MPANDALGSDQDQMAAPVATKGPNHDPEELVAGAEMRSLPGRPGQDRELMTQQDVLGDQCLAVADGRTDKAEQKKQVLEHRPNMMPLGLCTRASRLLHPDSDWLRMRASSGRR